MKLPIRISTVIFIVAFFFVIWIDLPDGMPIKFSIGSLHIDRVIAGPKVDVTLFGRQYIKIFETKLGLDLKGGSHLLFEADTKNISDKDRDQALESARNIIERRVNFFGVSEPQVQTIKSDTGYRLSVDLPGVENVDQAIALIGQTAQLEFKEEGAILQDSNPNAASQAAELNIGLNKSTGLTGKHIERAFVKTDVEFC